MCFDLESRPPIVPIAGGSLDQSSPILEADDGNRFRAFRARPMTPTGVSVIILPDVRGLHPYYEELALRFAEIGVDAIAIDYFGRTAGVETRRYEGFDHTPHVERTTFAGLAADVRAAAAELRSDDIERPTRLLTIGFCFGGRLALTTPTLGLGLAGAIGFYGSPVGARAGMPVPVDVAAEMECPVLGIFGGADPSIPAEAIASFETALSAAGVDHRLVVYPDAPHSFFDRKAASYAAESAAAWEEVQAFLGQVS
jgi:carboxymethylenebutenolidase